MSRTPEVRHSLVATQHPDDDVRHARLRLYTTTTITATFQNFAMLIKGACSNLDRHVSNQGQHVLYFRHGFIDVSGFRAQARRLLPDVGELGFAEVAHLLIE